MARYKVLQRSYINNITYDVGDEVEYDGIPADNLEPIDAAAKTVSKEARGSVETAVPADFSPTPQA